LFYESLVELIDDALRIVFGESVKPVSEHFSEAVVVNKYLNWLQNCQE
jgi:hypothetical protein